MSGKNIPHTPVFFSRGGHFNFLLTPNRVLVESHRDGTQSCLYHIIATFVGQSMTQVRRSLGHWYLQPVNQTRLRDFLPTNLQSPPAWSQRLHSAVDPSNLTDECDVYSLGLLFDISFQILFSFTSIRSSTYMVRRV